MSDSMFETYEDFDDLHIKAVNVYGNVYGEPKNLCRTYLNSDGPIQSLSGEYTDEFYGKEDTEYVANLLEKGLLRVLCPVTSGPNEIDHHEICTPINYHVNRNTDHNGGGIINILVTVIDPTPGSTYTPITFTVL